MLVDFWLGLVMQLIKVSECAIGLLVRVSDVVVKYIFRTCQWTYGKNALLRKCWDQVHLPTNKRIFMSNSPQPQLLTLMHYFLFLGGAGQRLNLGLRVTL